jgi:hypothetical protein
MAKSEETRMQFIELRAQGRSYKQICSQLNIAKSTAVDWGRELEHEIARLKAVELEALYDMYSMHKEARLKALGGLLQRMEAEIAQRDLSKVNTGRLLEIYLTYHQQAAQDAIEPRFISTHEEQAEKAHLLLLQELSI